MDRLISENKVLEAIDNLKANFTCYDFVTLDEVASHVKAIPSADPKKCKNCKWWRDSDGAYRRGVKAESKCPINTVSVANGWGYCYMFEPQERSEE